MVNNNFPMIFASTPLADKRRMFLDKMAGSDIEAMCRTLGLKRRTVQKICKEHNIQAAGYKPRPFKDDD